MNERIKKLAETAGFYFYDMHDVDGQDLGESIEADEWSAADKFAELIVLECAELVETQHTWITSVAASALIRKHFGVKE